MTQPRIGFIGLGMMGHGMAANLLRKGFPLAVKVHRDRSRLADIVAAGARECVTHAEVAGHSDFVILCVTGSPQVEEIVFGDKGLLAAARAGLVVIDTSTSEPGSTTRVREALAAKGTRFVDAPLARTPKEAEEGRLNSMVGADDETFALVKPVLAAFCENIFQMIGGGAVQGDLTRMKFSIANAAKDLRYYTHLAEALPVATFVGEAVHQSFTQAVSLGFGDRLLDSMIEAQERLNGMTIVKS